MNTPNNPPAFPAEEYIHTQDLDAINPVRHMGMTLRDYFAGQALAGMGLSGWERYSVWDKQYNMPQRHAQKFADRAYQYADAMLAARGQSRAMKEGA